MSISFSERLDHAITSRKSHLCIGLDPNPERMAIPDVTAFNRAIVTATADAACAYKLQLAFYEAGGSDGIRSLEETVAFIRTEAPGVLVIGDGKRGDIGSTATAYARAMFETWGFDAATVNAYQGRDAIEPFLAYEGRGAFVLCRTSNPSSTELQELSVSRDGQPVLLYRHVAELCETWSAGRGNVGLVVGATAPERLEELRDRHPEMPFLVPGIGAQGGDVTRVMRVAASAAGRGVILNSSRQILYASSDPDTFANAARRVALATREEITRALG